jgi:hypothetical protein
MERSESPPAREQQRCGPNTSNNYMTRLPGMDPSHTIAAGHVLAALSITALCIGAVYEDDLAKLPRMGVVFFTLSFAVRAILFKERFGETGAYSPSGVEMSLGAAALFVANAAASVATLAAPDLLLPLIGYATLDVVANWLNMVASAKTPSVHRFRFPLLVVSLANDAYVSSLIAGDGAVAGVTQPAFVLKSAHNFCLMCVAAKVVIARDSKAAVDAPKKTN